MKKKFNNLPKNFSVGVPEIDTQHEHLINLIGSLSGKCRKQRDISNIAFAMILKQTLYSIKYHINYEEKLMEETAYPRLEEHRHFHHYFFMNFLKQIRAFESRNSFVPEKLPDFLYDWLGSHFIMDLDMGLHIKNSGYMAA